jgi:hypothetical protein
MDWWAFSSLLIISWPKLVFSEDSWFVHRVSQSGPTSLEFDRNHNFRYIDFYLKCFSFLCGLSTSSILIVGRLRPPLIPVRRPFFLASILSVAGVSISISIGAWNLGPANLSLFSISLYIHIHSHFSEFTPRPIRPNRPHYHWIPFPFYSRSSTCLHPFDDLYFHSALFHLPSLCPSLRLLAAFLPITQWPSGPSEAIDSNSFSRSLPSTLGASTTTFRPSRRR